MRDYSDEEFLNIAGIQHYNFCRRQWALIHIEKLWAENVLTIEGNIVHENAHNDNKREKRGDIIITRGMEIRSNELGMNGICDVVEFHKHDKGIRIYSEEGRYLPIPVEYKKGKPKDILADKLQLCVQAICLEEMLVCDIPYAYLYYDGIKHRETVELNEELRSQVKKHAKEMHALYVRQQTPRAKYDKKCKSCSLIELCLPELSKQYDVKGYLKNMVKELSS